MRQRLSVALATGIGMAILGLWMAALILVCWFLILVWPSWIGLFLGLILLFLVLVTGPRVPRMQKDCLVVERTDTPRLFELLDQISQQMGAPKVEILAFDQGLNAGTLRVGLRRRFAIVVGMPLWEVSDPKERVALLSHEVAHETNGDLWRQPLLGTSIHMLAWWYELTAPGTLRDASERGQESGYGATEMLTWLLLAIPHWFLGQAVLAQHSLTLGRHRAAEFAADLTASSVAGSRGMQALLEKLMLVDSIRFALEQATPQTADLWDETRQRLEESLRKYRGTLWEAAMQEQTSVDATHPPTHLRLAAVCQGTFHPGLVLLDGSWNRQIACELEMTRSRIQAQIRNDEGY